jgi:hypothetical protein
MADLPDDLRDLVEFEPPAGSEANCRVVWVDETPAVPGSLYSVYLQCSKPENEAQETQSDVLLLPKDVNQILIGADFSGFKDYQRCPAMEPAAPR